MCSADVVVAGGGVAGLLIASVLSRTFSVILLEQSDSLPRNKYWLTDGNSAGVDEAFASCVDRKFEFLDFVAYDGLTATIKGHYALWDTDKLIDLLAEKLRTSGGTLLTGHQFYTLSYDKHFISVRANSLTLQAKLFIDCMGFGSPLVGAKNVATITGYYILHGGEIPVNGNVRPIALDNVVVNRNPAFFELFPTSRETAHAALILPSRGFKAERSIQKEFQFILNKSHYSDQIREKRQPDDKAYFGVVPVGRLRSPALDRIVFFGEAGQANPAASATGLTRMLRTYQSLANGIELCLKTNRLEKKDLLGAIPNYMTPMNRAFQESLFESLLSFDSDRFRRLVEELKEYPDNTVNDLLFAEFNFRGPNTLRLALDAVFQRDSVLGKNVLKSIRTFLTRNWLR